MTRQIMCLSPGKVARPLSEEKCSAATRPQSHKVCKTQECSTLYKIDHEGDLDDHYWRLSMWTPVMFLATTCCCCRMRSNTMQCFSLKLKKQWQRKFLTMKNIRSQQMEVYFISWWLWFTKISLGLGYAVWNKWQKTKWNEASQAVDWAACRLA